MSGARLTRVRWSRRCAGTPEEVWERFLERAWLGGAGLGPPPRIDERGAVDGLGCTRSIATLPGHRLRERITDTAYPSRLEYRVLDPSWATYPVDHHRGELRFEPREGGATLVTWCVEVVPKRGAGPLVAALTRFVIGRYLRVLERGD